MPDKPIPEPWLSFITEIDRALDSEVHFHCLGGFAITLLYELPRPTEDVDVLSAVILDRYDFLVGLSGKNSPLHTKYGVYLDPVGAVATVPDDYKKRLILIESPLLKQIRLSVMDPYDIVLSKVSRNYPRDIEDVKYLANAANLDVEILRHRYEEELKPYVIGPAERTNGNLRFWIEMIEEIRNL